MVCEMLFALTAQANMKAVCYQGQMKLEHKNIRMNIKNVKFHSISWHKQSYVARVAHFVIICHAMIWAPHHSIAWHGVAWPAPSKLTIVYGESSGLCFCVGVPTQPIIPIHYREVYRLTEPANKMSNQIQSMCEISVSCWAMHWRNIQSWMCRTAIKW